MKVPAEVSRIVQLAISSDANILITGPTGSGKTRLARQIHERGTRKSKAFVTVNLATLHEGTLESELFGHEKGAFTGAEQRRVGRLELAQGGTVFLDEIGDLSPRLQARLLEFLQFRTISPLGSNRELKLDLRVICATHRDLEEAVRRNEFREDLFHRIRVLAIPMKPLSERWDEFDEIVHDCLEDLCQARGRSLLRISEDAALRLENHPWPGNFRELRNVLEYAVLASTGPEINSLDLPEWFHRSPLVKSTDGQKMPEHQLGIAQVPLSLDYQETLAMFERDYLERALRRYRGRINQTARQIGINKTTLIRRMRSYGLKTELLS